MVPLVLAVASPQMVRLIVPELILTAFTGHYFLTSFDGSSCSCGPCHAHGQYFTADRQRFGCGTALHVCRGRNCVRAVVTDYGPSCFVENDAKGPVLDASPAVCKALTGGGSCGWSDHFDVIVSPAFDNRPNGPFNVTDEEYAEIEQRAREFAEFPSRDYYVEDK